jgi:hypothetical protein
MRPTPGNRPPSGHHFSKENLNRLNEYLAKEKPFLKGFEKAGLQEDTGTDGIKTAARMDTLKHLVYEAKIPLKIIFKNPDDYLSKGKPFSLIFETGYLQIDMSRMQGHGGMGENHGMSSGTPAGNSRMSFMQNMTEPSHLKLKSVYLFQK